MRATLAWFGPSVTHAPANDTGSAITTGCPQCGRQHITVFRLRHLTDSLFRKVGEYYCYAPHDDLERKQPCPNSNKSPDWGGAKASK